jgi:flagellin-like hook-associated protein FlgL
MAQVAEGGLSAMNDMLQRMRPSGKNLFRI